MNPDEIQRGNEGIDIGEWTGWNGRTDWAPYPIYPQPSDNPPSPKPADRLAFLCSYALVFVVLPALPFLAAAVRGWRP